MGADPESSVVDKWNRSWDVPNLYIVDGSVLATGGVVNPTATICALALRAAEHLRDGFRDLGRAGRPPGRRAARVSPLPTGLPRSAHSM